MTSKPEKSFWAEAGFRGPVCALLIFAFLLATNWYSSVGTDREFISNTAGDVWSYKAIADAAPAPPVEKVPYHHAQRFALPVLAGLMGHWIGIPNEWVMRGLVILMLLSAILLTERFANQIGFNPETRTVLTSLIFLNPYSARIGLSMPFMGNDIGFVLGLILLLSGLYMGTAWRMVVGSIIAIFCRQTAIFFIFPMGFFLLATEMRPFFTKARLTATACAIIVLAGYFVSGKVADSMSEGSHNLDTLIGLFIWIAKDFDWSLLALEFGGRPLTAWAMPVISLFLLRPYLRLSYPTEVKSHESSGRHTRLCSTAYLMMAGLIALQPILGGPGFGNLPRLSVLGLWALVFGIALLNRRESNGTAETRIPNWVLFPLLTFLALHSLHHHLTWPGRLLLNGDPRWFFVLQSALCAALLAGLAVRGRRSVPKLI